MRKMLNLEEFFDLEDFFLSEDPSGAEFCPLRLADGDANLLGGDTELFSDLVCGVDVRRRWGRRRRRLWGGSRGCAGHCLDPGLTPFAACHGLCGGRGV